MRHACTQAPESQGIAMSCQSAHTLRRRHAEGLEQHRNVVHMAPEKGTQVKTSAFAATDTEIWLHTCLGMR